jgi:hypothetical protein
MIRIQHCLVWSLAVGLLAIGCSNSEEPEEASSAPVISVFEQAPESLAAEDASDRSGEGGDPVVEGVTFEPANPLARERFRAMPRVSGHWTSLQYEWTLNGVSFGQNSAQVMLPAISAGDEIGLRVIPFRERDRGEDIEVQTLVRNQKPRLRRLSIERVDGAEGPGAKNETWRAVVVADDSDGDRLEIEYRWLVNGQESDVEDEFYPATELKRGDRVEVRARAFDGKVWSTSVRSGQIEIGHSLPIIVSVPPRPDRTGYFRYKVDVKDTGTDRKLHFTLRTSPRGMKIDEASGEVTWRPGSDQAGNHEVEIVVRDDDNGEATQSFRLALISVETSTTSPAALR